MHRARRGPWQHGHADQPVSNEGSSAPMVPPADNRPAARGPAPVMRFSSDDKHVIAARAATIDERHAAAGHPAPLPPSADDDALLRPWNQAYAPGDVAAFNRRLAWDGFDRPTAARMVRPEVAAGLAVPDEWVVWLDRVCDEAPGVRADSGSRRRCVCPWRVTGLPTLSRTVGRFRPRRSAGPRRAGGG